MSRRPSPFTVMAFLAAPLTLAPTGGCDTQPAGPVVVRDERAEAPEPKPTAPSTATLLEQLKDVPRDDYEARVRILEEVVDREPENRSAQLSLMEAAEFRGMQLVSQEGGRDLSKPFLYRAARAARDVLEMDAPLIGGERHFASVAIYNEACCLALDDEPERAVEALETAFKLGFRDPLIHDDPELDSLRDRDDFRRLLSEFDLPTETSRPVDEVVVPTPVPRIFDSSEIETRVEDQLLSK